MKKLVITSIFLLIFSVPALGKLDSSVTEVKKSEMNLPEGSGAPHKMVCNGMMSMVHTMPQHQQYITSHRIMVMRDMMQMMIDMLKMQKKMLRGASQTDKKEMLIEIDKMIDRLDKMMSEMRSMHMMIEIMGPHHMGIDKDDIGDEKSSTKDENEKQTPVKEEIPQTQHKH